MEIIIGRYVLLVDMKQLKQNIKVIHVTNVIMKVAINGQISMIVQNTGKNVLFVIKDKMKKTIKLIQLGTMMETIIGKYVLNVLI